MIKKKILLNIWTFIGLLFFNLLGANAAFPPVALEPNVENIPSLATMLEKVLPTVVSVSVDGVQRRPKQRELPFKERGSGVIIDAENGYVLTNNHVISDANQISIQLNDGREYTAKLIGRDEAVDIALLQLQDAKNLTAIPIADSDTLKVGDFAVAVGNPFGLGQTTTSGIISGLGRSGFNTEGLENFIQTDASINRGNSGGALINLKGELIGINTAILAPTGGNIGIGFAIPSNMARNLSQQLIRYGEVKRSTLGIRGREMSADLAKAFQLDIQRGAFVSEVLPNSAADNAGILAGDVLISFNDTPLTSFAELRAKIGSSTPGSVLKLGLLREGKSLSIMVTLDKSTLDTIHAKILHPSLDGATFSNGEFNGDAGIKVDEVVKDSMAEQQGLHKGDFIIGVNRERTQNIAMLRKVLDAKPPVNALHIIRAGEAQYLILH